MVAVRAARMIAIAAVTGAFLLPLAWTGLAAVGVLPDDSTRPPSWTGPPTLDHIAEIGVAEPTFWQELATSTVADITLAEAAVTAPLAVFVLHGAVAQLPTEWEEAAVIDGAGLFRILSRVVLPLIAPSVAATLVVMFVLDWNMLLVPLVLTSGEVKTVPVALSDFFTFERELDWPTAAAALMVSLAPLAVLVGVFHRVLERFALQAPGSRDIG